MADRWGPQLGYRPIDVQRIEDALPPRDPGTLRMRPIPDALPPSRPGAYRLRPTDPLMSAREAGAPPVTQPPQRALPLCPGETYVGLVPDANTVGTLIIDGVLRDRDVFGLSADGRFYLLRIPRTVSSSSPPRYHDITDRTELQCRMPHLAPSQYPHPPGGTIGAVVAALLPLDLLVAGLLTRRMA